MSSKTVLIAALSGRALAAAARRAGYAPLVVDAFGDQDVRESAWAYRCLPDATRRGFRATSLLGALDALYAEAPRPPVGLVLGSGFEDTPKLVNLLARRYTLVGNGGDAIARAKEPGALFPLLHRLAIGHPETSLQRPRNPEGWLSKRIGGSGGAHVLPALAAGASRHRYWQRRVDGRPVSVLAASGLRGVQIVGLSQQWTIASGGRPYRYGGAAGPVDLGTALAGRMSAAAEAVCTALALVGLVSLDFILADDTPLLLEVNPRPSATLDVFDDDEGSLFEAHIAACRGGVMPLPRHPSGARAAGVLYADLGALVVGCRTWPAWTADRPCPGTRIPLNRPLATVFAAAETATTAEYNCRRRLDELALVLYGRAADTERSNAEVYRPCPERLGAGGQAR